MTRPPLKFGRYQVEKRIGKGGMGTVYLALDTQLNRKVAVKVPHPGQYGQDATFRDRFKREATMLAQINHPNLCGVHDVGETAEVQYLVMPFIEGAPLTKHSKRGEPWEVCKAVRLICKLASALSTMHQHGIVHRDLKPANILIKNENGEPVITDFGLARPIATGSREITQPGVALGTPNYMSPEQWLGAETSTSTDIYSLGVILFQLLTSETPFQREGHVLTHGAPPPSTIRPDLDKELDDICLHALEYDVENRYRSMEEFTGDLEHYLEGIVPTPPFPQPPDLSSEQRKPRRSRGMLIPVIVLALLILIPVIYVGVLVNRGREEPVAPTFALKVPKDATHTTAKPPSPPPVTPKDEPPFSGSELKNAVGMEFVLIPKGSFWMGGGGTTSPTTEVTIPYNYYIGKFEVTQSQWVELMGSNPSEFSKPDKDKGITQAALPHFPVEHVSWEDAQKFLAELNKRCNRAQWEYRLPTVKEWERACRAAAASKTDCSFHFYFAKPTNDLSSTEANFDGEHPDGLGATGAQLRRPTTIGSYKPNALGLFDMHGNVAEWCNDLFIAGSRDRVVRGGGWEDWGVHCRALMGLRNSPKYRSGNIGLRVVLVPVGK